MTIEIPAPIVYVDVHGVVADFVIGAQELFGYGDDGRLYENSTYDFWKTWPDHVTDEEFWARINGAGEDFWADLPCLSAGARLVQELRDAGVEWAFCTAAVTHPGSYDGTVRFCKHWFGDCRVIGTTRKHELAGPNRVLIDDLNDNVEAFIEAGGVAYLWPQPWNTRNVLDWLLDFSKLKTIKGVIG